MLEDRIEKTIEQNLGNVVNCSSFSIKIDGFNVLNFYSSQERAISKAVNSKIDNFEKDLSFNAISPERKKAENIFSALLSIGPYFKGVAFDYSQVGRFFKELIALGSLHDIEIIFVFSNGRVERPMKELVNWIDQNEFGV